ncbi:hypothetical protein ACU3L3_14435 [Priestia endophytica]
MKKMLLEIEYSEGEDICPVCEEELTAMYDEYPDGIKFCSICDYRNG